MPDIKKPVPRWFTITAVVAIIWNLLGVSAFIIQVLTTPEMLAQLPAFECIIACCFSAADADLYRSTLAELQSPEH